MTFMTAATSQRSTRGFALLIKAPGVTRSFTPGEGETITIFDKNGNKVWSIELPAPNDNPGVTIHEVQIDLLSERDFGNFCQKTWTRGPAVEPATPQP
jgi:hypothetical protein